MMHAADVVDAAGWVWKTADSRLRMRRRDLPVAGLDLAVEAQLAVGIFRATHFAVGGL